MAIQFYGWCLLNTNKITKSYCFLQTLIQKTSSIDEDDTDDDADEGDDENDDTGDGHVTDPLIICTVK